MNDTQNAESIRDWHRREQIAHDVASQTDSTQQAEEAAIWWPDPAAADDVLATMSDDKERPVTVTSDEAIRFAQSVVESVAWEHADEWASECLQVAYRYAAPHDEDCGTEELVEAVARLARPAVPTPDAGERDSAKDTLVQVIEDCMKDPFWPESIADDLLAVGYIHRSAIAAEIRAMFWGTGPRNEAMAETIAARVESPDAEAIAQEVERG